MEVFKRRLSIFRATDEEVQKFFESYISPEEIVRLSRVKNNTGKPRGFAFLEVKTEEALEVSDKKLTNCTVL